MTFITQNYYKRRIRAENARVVQENGGAAAALIGVTLRPALLTLEDLLTVMLETRAERDRAEILLH